MTPVFLVLCLAACVHYGSATVDDLLDEVDGALGSFIFEDGIATHVKIENAVILGLNGSNQVADGYSIDIAELKSTLLATKRETVKDVDTVVNAIVKAVKLGKSRRTALMLCVRRLARNKNPAASC